MKITFLLVPLLLAMACSDSKAPKNTTSTVQGVLPGSGTVIGTLAIDPAATGIESPPTDVIISVQNHPEATATVDVSGNYVITNVTPGTINIIAVGVGGTGLTNLTFGVKIDGVKVSAREATDNGKSLLKKTGSIKGLATFFENPNNLELAGSDVYVPGTDIIAKSDSTGAFALSGLPEGTYELKVQHAGFAVTTLETVKVTSDAVTDLGDIPLSLALGPEGSIAITADSTATIAGVDSKISLKNAVAVTFKYDSDAALMKVSDEPSFLNQSWKPVQKAMDWTFDSDGKKTLYVMYSDLNGLESSPFSDVVYIDTTAPVIESVTLMEGWNQVASRAAYFDTVQDDEGAGVAEMMISNASDFSGAVWVPYIERQTWTLSEGEGLKTVYVKVKDRAGRESAAATDSINKGATTNIELAVEKKDLTLWKEYSPYRLPVFGRVGIEGNLTLRPGTLIEVVVSGGMLSSGIFKSEGTLTDPVTIVAAGACGAMNIDGMRLDISGNGKGSSSNNILKYTRFVNLGMLALNGGLVSNNVFDNTECPYFAGTITKSGFDPLRFENNEYKNFESGMVVEYGNGLTNISNNTGTMAAGFSQTNDATNSILRNNTIEFLSNSAVPFSGGTWIESGNTWMITP